MMNNPTMMPMKQPGYDLLYKIGEPIFAASRQGMLRELMPVRSEKNDRAACSHLEAVGRFLAGAAPALELQLTSPEDPRFAAWIQDARDLLGAITDPASPQCLNFREGQQPLVDAAFLAQALLRAPKALWHGLAPPVQQNVLAALRSTRAIRPSFNNWLLFSGLIEAFFCAVGQEWDRMRVDYALRQHEQWYVGDGCYSDGPLFHWDYYNSIVIHPMLLDLSRAVQGTYPEPLLKRARRHAQTLERLIGPDGSFALIGRSLAYRCGVFHLLAQLALIEQLPTTLKPAQVRSALTAVIQSTLGSPRNFDDNGWLHIGLNGHQPTLGEAYISTGSLYLCATAFLPLGLPAQHPYWSDPDVMWTQRAAFWLGLDVPADKAI